MISSIVLEEAGFDYDSSENLFVRRGSMDTFVGVRINVVGIEVSVCGVSDEYFETLEKFQTLEETFKFINKEGL